MQAWEDFPLLGNDMVKIRDDSAEHPEAPKVVLARERSWNASHQEKPGNLGWRRPGPDAAFGFVVEQLFATKSGTPILPEGDGISHLPGPRSWSPHKGHLMRHPRCWLRRNRVCPPRNPVILALTTNTGFEFTALCR